MRHEGVLLGAHHVEVTLDRQRVLANELRKHHCDPLASRACWNTGLSVADEACVRVDPDQTAVAHVIEAHSLNAGDLHHLFGGCGQRAVAIQPRCGRQAHGQPEYVSSSDVHVRCSFYNKPEGRRGEDSSASNSRHALAGRAMGAPRFSMYALIMSWPRL